MCAVCGGASRAQRVGESSRCAVQVKLLFRLPVFKGVPVPLLRELAAIMERRTYRLGSFIFRQGENASSLFVLASGSVRIVRQMRVSDSIARMHRLVRTRCCRRVALGTCKTERFQVAPITAAMLINDSFPLFKMLLLACRIR